MCVCIYIYIYIYTQSRTTCAQYLYIGTCSIISPIIIPEQPSMILIITIIIMIQFCSTHNNII